MSDHSIIIDMRYPQSSTFECKAPNGTPCHASWECECETIWGYRRLGGNPVHDTTMEGAEGLGNEIHVGYFDSTQCNLTEWHDNQDEAVEGTVRVDVKPVSEIDCVTFTATAARIEKDS
ncbi:hypothetical protein [Brevibacterium aurantiacum]|uniref:Uncharacterized protein n=1 Tax=Brevibacterium aurantiacum TaxID=273384 RepID=A0A556C5B8_BREAU|nr:hypothetical protein [Brevibacterium aurantiacum]TSI12654.1 hypothetical protein FO013_19465 [Brevibacterium aurantiacum]